MTREQMLKYKFKPYQPVIYKNPRTNKETEYILLGVDFDCETFKLGGINVEYVQDDFYLPIALCTPSSKLCLYKNEKR